MKAIKKILRNWKIIWTTLAICLSLITLKLAFTIGKLSFEVVRDDIWGIQTLTISTGYSLLPILFLRTSICGGIIAAIWIVWKELT